MENWAGISRSKSTGVINAGMLMYNRARKVIGQLCLKSHTDLRTNSTPAHLAHSLLFFSLVSFNYPLHPFSTLPPLLSDRIALMTVLARISDIRSRIVGREVSLWILCVKECSLFLWRGHLLSTLDQ